MEQLNPVHPGRILRVYMEQTVTISELAKHLGMTRANLSMILNGRMGISALVAIKLAETFPNTDARFWMTLQMNYELARARRTKRRKLKTLSATVLLKQAA